MMGLSWCKQRILFICICRWKFRNSKGEDSISYNNFTLFKWSACFMCTRKTWLKCKNLNETNLHGGGFLGNQMKGLSQVHIVHPFDLHLQKGIWKLIRGSSQKKTVIFRTKSQIGDPTYPLHKFRLQKETFRQKNLESRFFFTAKYAIKLSIGL